MSTQATSAFIHKCDGVCWIRKLDRQIQSYKDENTCENQQRFDEHSAARSGQQSLPFGHQTRQYSVIICIASIILIHTKDTKDRPLVTTSSKSQNINRPNYLHENAKITAASTQQDALESRSSPKHSTNMLNNVANLN